MIIETERLLLKEMTEDDFPALKFFPVGDVWNEFCARNGVKGDESWFEEIIAYEKDVLFKR